MSSCLEAIPSFQNERSPNRRLKVGYVSPDFRDHPIGRLVEPVIGGHDPERVEVFCYSNLKPPGDALTTRIRGLRAKWRDVMDLTDADLVKQIRDDKIDILVETAGHFGGNRLPAFALKPAPVQINAFGWCGTTGLAAIDYRITDAYSDPPGTTDSTYVEELIRLPHCAWVYRPCDGAPDVDPLPAITNGYITFANLNNPIKTTPAMASLWAGILRAVPGSKLMLLCNKGNEQLSLNRFEHVPRDRLILEHNRKRAAYLALFNRIDIVLDPFPFAGDNSTCDALWMGVPVISLVGNAYHSRRGLSHLMNVGLGDLATPHPDEYLSAAIKLANDTNRLTALRATLRERLKTSPLGNVPTFVTELERAYRVIWAEWCANCNGPMPAVFPSPCSGLR